MTINEKITKFLYHHPEKNQLFSLTKSDDEDFREAFDLTRDAGLFEKSGNSYRFNITAMRIIEKGWTYDQYLKKLNKTKTWWQATVDYLMEHIIPILVSTIMGAAFGYWLAQI